MSNTRIVVASEANSEAIPVSGKFDQATLSSATFILDGVLLGCRPSKASEFGPTAAAADSKEIAMTMSEELSKLAELRAGGTLTEDEFARAKARLLNDQGARADEPVVAAVNSFRRSRSDRVLGGVCGGMARATGAESWVWRLIFTVLFIFAGAGLLLYLLLWIFVPSE
jgi:phage shock protein C